MGVYVRLMLLNGILGEDLRHVPIPIFREPSWRQPSTAKAGFCEHAFVSLTHVL